MIATDTQTRGSSFLKEVVAEAPGGERVVHCLQCGSCGGSCPNGADMQYTPRTLFAMINADQREEVLTSNTMWCCVSCYFCTTRCPQNIPITDIMYALKPLSIRDGLAKDADAPALAKTFTDLLDRYGRSYELGLAKAVGKELGHLAAAPLLWDQETYGVLLAGRDAGKSGFGEAHLEWLSGLADYTAIAVRNAQVHQQAHHREHKPLGIDEPAVATLRAELAQLGYELQAAVERVQNLSDRLSTGG